MQYNGLYSRGLKNKYDWSNSIYLYNKGNNEYLLNQGVNKISLELITQFMNNLKNNRLNSKLNNLSLSGLNNKNLSNFYGGALISKPRFKHSSSKVVIDLF